MSKNGNTLLRKNNDFVNEIINTKYPKNYVKNSKIPLSSNSDYYFQNGKVYLDEGWTFNLQDGYFYDKTGEKYDKQSYMNYGEKPTETDNFDYTMPEEWKGTPYEETYNMAKETGILNRYVFRDIFQAYQDKYAPKEIPEDVDSDLNTLDYLFPEEKELPSITTVGESNIPELNIERQEEEEYDENLGFTDPSSYSTKRLQKKAMKDLGWTEDDINTYYKNQEDIPEVETKLSVYDKMRNANKAGSVLGTIPEIFGVAMNTADLIANTNKDFEPMIYEDSTSLSRIEAPSIYEPSKRAIDKNAATAYRQLRESGNPEALSSTVANLNDAELKARTAQAQADLDAKNKTTAINAQEKAAGEQRSFQADTINDANYRKWLQEKQIMNAYGKNAIYKGGTNLSTLYNSYLANNMAADIQEELSSQQSTQILES